MVFASQKMGPAPKESFFDGLKTLNFKIDTHNDGF